jgi:uncharacterized protein (DUF1810 family)
MDTANTRNSDDPHNLQRFLTAQERDYAHALVEIKRGEKRTHWMWFIFPQFDGLGYSSTSKYYAIKSIEEARNVRKHWKRLRGVPFPKYLVRPMI